MNDSEFMALAEKTLARIEASLETCDADLDCSRTGEGVLEIEFADGSKMIVNRHSAAREICVAARSGGFHFSWNGQEWCDTRSGKALLDMLAVLVAAQAGHSVVLR